MTLLLDTQVALWWLIGSRRLGVPARKLLAESACVLSAASVWEVAFKHRLGKLPVGPALNSLMAVIAPVLGAPLLTMVSHLPQGDWRIGTPFFFCALLQAASLVIAVVHFRRERLAVLHELKEGIDNHFTATSPTTAPAPGPRIR